MVWRWNPRAGPGCATAGRDRRRQRSAAAGNATWDAIVITLQRCWHRVTRKGRGESGWSGDLVTMARLFGKIKKEVVVVDLFLHQSRCRVCCRSLTGPLLLGGVVGPIIHLCSGAHTSLRQQINSLCDVSCQGSRLITRRLQTSLASLCTEQRAERDRHARKKGQTTAFHTFASQTPNRDLTHMMNI